MRSRRFPVLLLAAFAGAPLPALAQAQAWSTVPQPQSDADRLAAAMRTLGSSPQNVDALVTAGELSLRLGDASGAASLFARADKVDPRNARVKAGMGALLVHEERPGEALRYFNMAEGYGLAPTRFAAERALAYDLIGEQERAQRDYRVALANGRDDEIIRRYALSLGIAGRKDEALAQIDPLVRKNDRGAWRARAFILAMTGDVDGANKIATTMMPGGMAQGLAPFFARLPRLAAADRAFAVHFGEVRPTPQRLADARLTPPLPALGPEPGRATMLASVQSVQVPTAKLSPREERRERQRLAREQREAARLARAQAARPTTPAATRPPVALAAVDTARLPTTQPATARQERARSASPGFAPFEVARGYAPRPTRPAITVRPQTTVAAATTAPSSLTGTTTAAAAPPVATSSTSVATTSPGQFAVTPAPTRPPASLAAAAVPSPRPQPAAAPVTTAARTVTAPPAAPSVPASASLVVPPRPQTAAGTQIVAAATTITAAKATAVPPTVAAVTTLPAAATPAATTPAGTNVAAAAATTSPAAPAVTTPAATLPVVAATKPVPPKLSEDSILARIIAGISIPASELDVAAPPRPAAVVAVPARVPTAASTPATRAAAAPAKPAATRTTTAREENEPDAAPAKAARTAARREEGDTGAPTAKSARATRTASRDEAAPVRTAKGRGRDVEIDRRTTAADKKKAATEARADRAEPARIWVQVAGGANETDLNKAWRAQQGKAAALKGKAAYSTPLRATNRVVTGPFKTDAEARAFVNTLSKQGVSAFPFTSDKGQKMTKLGTSSK